MGSETVLTKPQRIAENENRPILGQRMREGVNVLSIPSTQRSCDLRNRVRQLRSHGTVGAWGG